MSKSGIRSFFIILFLVISSFFNIGSSSFVVEGEAKQEEISINDAGGAVCYTKSDNVRFTTIEKAISVANSRSSETVVVNLGITTSVSNSISIESGTTLLIPHDDTLNSYTFSQTGSAVRKSLINLTNGADIDVKTGGKLVLGGTFGTRGINGAYSQIALGTGSSIIVNGTAQLYGYVTETNPICGNKDQNNIVYDNSLDSQRYINVGPTGNVESVFYSYDMGSGNTILSNIKNKICPTYLFDFKNLQTYVRVNYGGKIKVMAYVEVSGQSKNALCGLVGTSEDTSTNYIFYINSGDIGIEYCNNGKTLIYVNGNSHIGSLYINTGIYNAIIDSKEYDLPISSKFDIFINGTFSTNSRRIKFLPGSSVTVNEGSYFYVSGTGTGEMEKSKVFIYEANTMIAIGITSYGTIDSKFINNGTMVVNEYGAISGPITTNNSAGTSTVDLSLVSSSEDLAMTTVEGETAELTTPLLEFKGPFYDESNEETNISNSFFECSTIYNSHLGLPCYDGNISKLYTVTINVLDTTFKHNAYEYSLYTNDSASDTGQTIKYEGVNNITSNTIEVSNNSYIKITDSKCDYITINGQSYTIGTWVKINANVVVEIQPKEAFVITCNHTGGQSGAGRIERSITYGPNSSSLSYSESTTVGAAVTATMPKGWVFKVSDNATVKGTSQVIKTTYDENGNGTSEVIASKSGGLAWSSSTIYTADADYKFTSDNVTCIVEGTKITMADGTIKNVENLVVGDLVQVFNHETGQIDVSPIIFITHKDEGAVRCDTIELCFSNGKTLKIANDHALFDKTTNRYEVLNEHNYSNYINHEFAIITNGMISLVKLQSANVVSELVRVYCPVTAFHMNLFANDMLTMPTFPYDIQGLYNIFDLDENMKYDEERKEIDINTYGLFTYEEFIKIIDIPIEAFNISPAVYLKVSLGKGLITEDQIRLGINYLLNNSLI